MRKQDVILRITSLALTLSTSAALTTSTHAYAAEVWSCTLSTVPDDLHRDSTSGSVKFRIDGKILDIQIQSPLSTFGHDPTLDILTQQGAFRYQVLEDNDVGVVAANTRSKTVGDLGPLVGAAIIVINKSNGELHIGSVVQDGAHDLEFGHCGLE